MKNYLLPWKRYPAGAHAFVFQNALCLYVAKYKNRLGNTKWCAVVFLDYGALYVADKLNSSEDAIVKAEKWLKNHMQKLLRSEIINGISQ